MLGTRIVEGRAFDERDTATSLPVVIVNETFARRYWPGQSAIGKRVRFDTAGARWLQVVGIAADGKYRQWSKRSATTSSRRFRRTRSPR